LIKTAFEDRRKQLVDEAQRGGKRRVRNREPAVVVLERQVARLEAEKKVLLAELDAYEARFRRMVLNLHRGATTEEEMDNPMPHRVEKRTKDE
jgi:hypothetical protein